MLWWGQTASESETLCRAWVLTGLCTRAGRNSAHLVPNLGIVALRGLGSYNSSRGQPRSWHQSRVHIPVQSHPYCGNSSKSASKPVFLLAKPREPPFRDAVKGGMLYLKECLVPVVCCVVIM